MFQKLNLRFNAIQLHEKRNVFPIELKSLSVFITGVYAVNRGKDGFIWPLIHLRRNSCLQNPAYSLHTNHFCN